EERDQVLRPLGENGQEAVGSMGDDTPMAVLSSRVRTVYDYFRQQFAPVTNPAIHPLREAVAMSLETSLRAERHVFEKTPPLATRALLSSPIISPANWRTLTSRARPGVAHQGIDRSVDADVPLAAAVAAIAGQAEAAVRAGKTLLVLSDR